jgi:hypothetical protein
MRSVIHILNARNMKSTDIHRQCENVHDDPWRGRQSEVNKDFVRAVEEKIQENRRFTIPSLSAHFTQISRSILHKIVPGKLRFRKLCSRWVPKLLTEEHKMKPATWHA